jgi:hypothetical protein
VHPLRHPSGRNPDPAPRPMLRLYGPQSIYAPLVLARQGVESSVTITAFVGPNFLAAVIA